MDCMFCFFFFKQKTAYELRISDWSSDVCSSDLLGTACRTFGSGAPDTRGGRCGCHGLPTASGTTNMNRAKYGESGPKMKTAWTCGCICSLYTSLGNVLGRTERSRVGKEDDIRCRDRGDRSS